VRRLELWFGDQAMQQKADPNIEAEIARIRSLTIEDLRSLWRTTFRSAPPVAFTKDLLGRDIAYCIQEKAYGGLDRATLKLLEGLARGGGSGLQLKLIFARSSRGL